MLKTFQKAGMKTYGLAALFAAFVFLLPKMAQAQGVGSFISGAINYVMGATIAWVVYIINYIIATIFGIIIFIIAWLIGIVLQLNTNIVQAPIVQNGFTITLAVANLGFVLAIIIIAIMTIIRYETYALKSTLWKLVAAAILVNFSLVICAAILNFADTLTRYFLDAISRGCTTGTSALNPASYNPFDCFATSIADAFAPQRLFLSPSQIASFDSSKWGGAAGVGLSFSGVLTPLLNIFFPTLFLIIAVIALAGLFIMLLIRYIYLGILLILMPFAWLLWIFPVTSGQWSKWWSKFIQWTIFAPVVMFFIYLSILSMGGSNDPNAFFAALKVQPGDGGTLVGAFAQSIGVAGAASNFTSGMLGTILQMAMMTALLFAGLFMANAMGITFADATLKGATAVTSGFGGFVKRRGMLIGGATMDRLKVKERAQKLQQTRLGTGMMRVGANMGRTGRMLTSPIRGVGKALNFGVGMAGRGVETVHVATREDMVKEAQGRIGKEETRQLVNGMSTFTSPERMAAILELSKRDSLDALNMEDTHRKETKELFKTYGSANDYEKNVEKKSGVSSEMYEAAKALGEAVERGAPPGEIDTKQKVLDDLAASFAAKFSRGDVGAMQAADLHSKQEGKFGLNQSTIEKLAAANAYGFAVAAPQFASSILSKLKGKSLDNFEGDYRTNLQRAVDNGDIGVSEGQKRLQSFNQSILNNTMGFVPVDTTAGAAPAAPTPPPTP